MAARKLAASPGRVTAAGRRVAFDALEKETGERLPDSPTRRVGGAVLAGFEEHAHLARLWSMGKAQSIDALLDWARRAEKLPRFPGSTKEFPHLKRMEKTRYFAI